MQFIKNRFAKITLWLIASILILFLSLALALQTSYVQTKVVKYISEILSEKTSFDISIDHISISWFDQIVIDGLKVVDPEQNSMGFIKEITIDYNYSTMISDDQIIFDEVKIDSTHILLAKIPVSDTSTIINMTLFSNNIAKLITPSEGKAKEVLINDISLVNSYFTYYDYENDSIRDGLDYYHFTIGEIYSNVSDFIIVADTVMFSVDDLVAKELKTQMDIIHVKTKFLLNSNKLELSALDAKIGQSHITDYLSFNYESLADFSFFNDKIKLKAHFINTLIDTKNVSTLFPFEKNIFKKINLTGQLEGEVSSFALKDFTILFDEKNSIQGGLRLFGLPLIDETFIDLKLTKSYVETKDIIEFFKPKTQKLLGQFEYASFTGKFLGFFNDFVAYGDFSTDLGQLKSNINLKLFDNNPPEYIGNLELINFNLKQYADRPFLDKVTLKSKIEGKGLTFSTADFLLNGTIKSIGINNYNYTNITTNAQFSKEHFKGILSIKDPNIEFKIDGNIDLKQGNEKFNLSVDLKKAQLDSLNIVEQDVFVIADFNIDAKGIKMDDIQGKVDVKNVFIDYNNTPLFFDSLSIRADNIGLERRFKLISDLIDWEFSGKFNYNQLLTEVKNLYNEYKLNLNNDSEQIVNYYIEKRKQNNDYKNDFNIIYQLDLKDLNPLIQLIPGENHISKNIHLNGIYQSGYTTMAAFSSQIDTLIINGNAFYNNNIDISASKIADSTNVIAAVYIFSEEQLLSNTVNTKNLLLETYWNNQNISFESNIEQLDNTLQLIGNVNFLKDTTVVHFDSSKMIILDNQWNFDQGNSIKVSGKNIEFEKFNIKSDNRFISISGLLSEDKSKELTMDINDFDLEFINPAVQNDFFGQLNGYIKLREFYDNPILENELSITQFKVDSFFVGNIFAQTKWSNSNRSLRIDSYVTRKGFETINVNGFYYPDKPYSPLDLKVNFDKANLNILETILGSQFSNIHGNATGIFTINGFPKSPVIKGDCDIENGTIKIDYLNTDYRFSGKMGFDKNNIIFHNLDIIDINENKGVLKGNINHDSFKNMFFDLHGTLDNFQVLNTSSKDNSLFYGTGIATGNVDFTGPLENLTVNALATTNKGTKIFIPVEDSGNIEQESFITFKNFSDSTYVELEEDGGVDLKGINLNFDLDITQDAYCEIIFDIKSGDIIRGRGEGRINMQIDTQGEFNMFGDYIIKQGGYNFTLYNIINKEFEISPDSKISWFGDPYQGILDINAKYKQLTSLVPIVADTSFHKVAAIRRSYPVELYLGIKGPLLSPNINFNIDITEYPSLSIQNNVGSSIYLEDVVSDFKNKINTDEHELNRQVFSLLVLRKFSPPESFNTTGSIGSSVSEFVSNQLSYWVSQVDENLEIDVDLGSLDAEAFNTFQLRLAYTMLDGRLRISREGGFGNNANNQSQQTDVAGIVGDWTVEYVLTKDGKFRAKMYNRTNYNTINNSIGTGTSTSAGVSIQHTQSFNEIKDLWQRERVKKEKSMNSEAIKEEDENL